MCQSITMVRYLTFNLIILVRQIREAFSLKNTQFFYTYNVIRVTLKQINSYEILIGIVFSSIFVLTHFIVIKYCR